MNLLHIIRFFAAMFVASLILPGRARAHEMRPLFVDIHETAPASFSLVLRYRQVDASQPSPEIRWPAGCTIQRPAERSVAADFVTTNLSVSCGSLSAEGSITINGLSAELPEAVIRTEFIGGLVQTSSATRANPHASITRDASTTPVGLLGLGVRHILSGFDHLLFVFGLMLLAFRRVELSRARRTRLLVGTITAFTVAHSITLGLSAFGAFSLPARGVEAVIALSILMLAIELARPRTPTSTLSVLQTRPWLAAFAFGLLHGFGFATALKELDLERSSLLFSLLTFNVGVEVGQLAFIGLLVVIFVLLRRSDRLSKYSESTMVNVMGAASAFWCLDRTIAILQ